VASPVNQRTETRRAFWASIARIFVIEIAVLIALSAAIVGYLNWSSEAAWSEFRAASQLQAPQSSQALHAVTHRTACGRSV
jgi:hypothetical protein